MADETPQISLQTPRLLLRPWRESDRELFAAMNANPMTMRFFPSLWSREQSDAAFERVQKHWRDHGFGIWVAEIQGQFAGTLGLQHVPFEAFSRRRWNWAIDSSRSGGTRGMPPKDRVPW